MQKPNVLFISSWYPSKEHSTLGNFVQRHAEAINPFVNLYVVYVVSSNRILSNFDIENEMINGVNTTIVYYKKVTSKLPLFSSFQKLKRYREGYKRGIEFIEKQFNVYKIDITHCNVTFPVGLIALNLKKKRNIPYVLTEHWTLFLPYKNDFEKLSSIKKKKIKEIIENANQVMPVSSHLRNSMKGLGLKGKYRVIANVVNSDLFTLGDNLNNEKKRILHVSTLVNDQKNVQGIFSTLKEIAKSRNDFKLIIVSDGDIAKAKEIQRNIGLDEQFVEYHSTKTPIEIVEFYKSSDFFLLFSNYENLPVVISESLCCGLPIVSSSVGGIPEMINKRNGLIVNPEDNKALEIAINTMLNNLQNYSPTLIRKQAVKRYENKVVGKQYYDLYKEIVK